MDWKEMRAWLRDYETTCLLTISAPAHLRIQAYFIWMVFAIAAELDPQSNTSSSAYYDQGWKHLEPVMASYDLVSIQGLLLAVFYAFRSKSVPSLWLLSGNAVRMCVDMGFHRAQTKVSPHERERRARTFWSAYAFDRIVAHSTNRPTSIDDRDIDVDMPLDVNSDLSHLTVINGQVTDLTCAIHSIELYRIRSRVHTAFYALDAPIPSADATAAFLQELESWRVRLPIRSDRLDIPVQDENRFQMRYLQCVLYTLRPSIIQATTGDFRLSLCAVAAAEACEVSLTEAHWKRLKVAGSIGTPVVTGRPIDRVGMPYFHLQYDAATLVSRN